MKYAYLPYIHIEPTVSRLFNFYQMNNNKRCYWYTYILFA